jgi:Lrp/AsnC family transcriptional regulator, leucine-responsive regulatory protein
MSFGYNPNIANGIRLLAGDCPGGEKYERSSRGTGGTGAVGPDDSTRSYTELGQELHLSAPAVHERVKRLKRDGVIVATAARLHGARVGRPLLAFVHVNTRSLIVSRQLLKLSSLPEIEEIHTVTGESGMLLKVRTRDTQALEDLLAKIHAIDGFDGTRSHIAMTTYLERGPSPEA